LTPPVEPVDPHSSRIADELLVVRCQLGEPEAFDDLIARWHGPLWSYIRRVIGQRAEAEDTLQDVWLRVIRGIAHVRDGSRLRGWMFGIARRALMDRLRRQYRLPPAADVDAETLVAEPEAGLEADLEALDVALEKMPVTEREVLILFHLQELSLAEIAETLNLPIGTVKSRLFRARRMARALLQSEVES
jgi:RNA polymerase sigma-70 factor (ECF subfamily)